MRFTKKVLAFVLCLAMLLGSIMDYVVIGHAQSNESEVKGVEETIATGTEEVEAAEAEAAETEEVEAKRAEAAETEEVEAKEAEAAGTEEVEAAEAEGTEERGKTSEEKEEKASDIPEGEITFTGEGFTIVQKVDSIWTDQEQKGYKAEVTITNTGADEIESWSLQCTMKDKIVNIWNAKLQEKEEKLIISADYGNINIAPQESICFGYQAVCGMEESPAVMENIELLGIRKETEEADYEVKTEVTSQWGNGNIMEITISNKGNHTIKGWEIAFSFRGEITNLWNGTLSGDKQNGYRVKCKEYNSWIEPGESVCFGFQAEYGEVQPEDTIQVQKMTEIADGSTGRSEEQLPEDMDLSELRRWNRTMMGLDSSLVQEAVKKKNTPVKVAMLDSGVDLNEGMMLAGRINLIPGEDEMTEIYEDATGHGTAVASVMMYDAAAVHDWAEEPEEEEGAYQYEEIENEEENDLESLRAALGELGENDPDFDMEDIFSENLEEEDGYESTDSSDSIRLGDFVEQNQADFKGVNPYMELYSVRVLDEQNGAPIERVVEGIRWAREHDIKVLNISFGTEENSEELYQEIRAAYEEGMLIIAACANDGSVQYPAAYDEVVGVGAVDINATLEDCCETDPYVEIAAPAEGLLAVGPFGVEIEAAGTSLAAAEVTGVASILWENYPKLSRDGIRSLLSEGAYRPKEEGSLRIVNCENCLEMAEDFEESRHSDTPEEEKFPERQEGFEPSDDNGKAVVASWGKKGHLGLVSDSNIAITDEYLKILKIGTRLQDCGFTGLNNKYKYALFHGNYIDEKKQNANYIGGYLYLTRLAEQVYGSKVIMTTGTAVNGDIVTDAAFHVDAAQVGQVADMMNGIIQDDGIYENKETTECKAEWNEIFSSKLYLEETKSGDKPDTRNEEFKEINEGVKKGLVIYGMGLHTLGDTYAHSTMAGYWEGKGKNKKYVWGKIAVASEKSNLYKKQKGSKLSANDTKKIFPMRYKLAGEAVKNSLNHIVVASGSGMEIESIGHGELKDYCPAYIFDNNIMSDRKMIRTTDRSNILGYIKGNAFFPSAYIKNGFGLRDFYSNAKEYWNENLPYAKKIRVYIFLKDVDHLKRLTNDKTELLFKIKLPGAKKQTKAVTSVYKVDEDGKERVVSRGTGSIGAVFEQCLRSIRSKDQKYRVQTECAGAVYTFSIDMNTPYKEVPLEEGEELMMHEWEISTDLSGHKKSNVSGIVTDALSAGSTYIDGAEAVLQYQDGSGETLRAETSDGRFLFRDCNPGMYTLRVEKEGYESYEQNLLVDEETQGSSTQMIGLVPESGQTGTVKGYIRDSVNTMGISQITIRVRKGFYNYGEIGKEDVVMTIQTDVYGGYRLTDLPAGYYCMEMMDESDREDKYMLSYVNFFVAGGMTRNNENYYLSQSVGSGEMRIVLTWGNRPYDLDSHAVFWNGELYYRNESIYLGNVMVASLDRDDTDGEGPETVTVDTNKSGSFRYFVYNFSKDSVTGLARSNAVVWVYRSGYQPKMYTVPLDLTGYTWNVFRYDSSTNQIINE